MYFTRMVDYNLVVHGLKHSSSHSIGQNPGANWAIDVRMYRARFSWGMMNKTQHIFRVVLLLSVWGIAITT